jgi:3-dehydroquinate synthetase
MAKRIKTRLCAYSLCKKEFKPTYSTLQECCSIGCSINYNKKKEVDKRVKKMKADLKTHKDYIQILQGIFNTYIRLRDKGGVCISCQNPLGETYHAGHFFPTTKQYLRFNEDNVHGQCVQCNMHFHGNLTKYAYYLPKKIGWDRFEDLHAMANMEMKLSIPEINELILKYKNLIKDINTPQ